MAGKTAKRRPIGQQQREVIQPQSAATWRRLRSRPGLEMDERRVATKRTKRRARSLARDHTKADDLLVILERSLEIAHEKYAAPRCVSPGRRYPDGGMPYCMGWPAPEVATLREPLYEAYLATSYDARGEIVGEADDRTECARQGPPADARSEVGPTPDDLTVGDAKDALQSAGHRDPSVRAPGDNRNREPLRAAAACSIARSIARTSPSSSGETSENAAPVAPHARCVRRGGCSRRAPQARRS